VFVTHDQDEALSMATRIAIMSGGQVAQTGSPREVYDHPVNRFVADFVGETNFMTGTIESDGSRPMFVIPGGERVLAPGGSADGPATLMLRPESVAIRAVGEATADTGIMGRVTNVAFLGNHTRITVTTAAGEIFAVRPHGTGGRTTGPLEEVGKEVCVWWAADDAALIGD
jgi:spermidine/putrescine transport system ATP-binding protein